jgi:hypothetical protein
MPVDTDGVIDGNPARIDCHAVHRVMHHWGWLKNVVGFKVIESGAGVKQPVR